MSGLRSQNFCDRAAPDGESGALPSVDKEKGGILLEAGWGDEVGVCPCHVAVWLDGGLELVIQGHEMVIAI